MRLTQFVAAICLPIAAGCNTDPKVGLDSQDPTGRLIALRDAAAAEPPTDEQIRGMLEALDSEDAAARQIAIVGLSRLAGSDLGYDAGAESWERESATRRWLDWYAHRLDPAPAGG